MPTQGHRLHRKQRADNRLEWAAAALERDRRGRDTHDLADQRAESGTVPAGAAGEDRSQCLVLL
jgi:hypothetical protein